jgi:protein gp37
MGKDSAIVWTDHTFNPWWGCVKLPDRRECDNCYAAGMAARTGHKCWGPKSQRRLFGAAHWQELFKWDAAAFDAGQRSSVFCGSMCDVFEDHPDAESQRPKLWDYIRRTPSLRWLLLSKRSVDAPRMLPADLWQDNPRVLVGATVGTPQPIHWVDFLSCEPLLGPLDLTPWFQHVTRLRTVIVGAESSGPRPGRPCELEWVRSIVRQCADARVSCFVKQLHINGKLSHDPSEWPADLRVRELAWRDSPTAGNGEG